MITIASVPTKHPYVAHLAPTSGVTPSGVERLPDPRPAGAGDEDRWWPPRWLEPDWLEAHIEQFDVLHLHFGFDAIAPSRLRDITDILRRHRKPLVFTVHDLHNPHFADDTLHRSQLDVLVPAAAEVVTLTDSAAREITARWGVPVSVLPHPHVVPLGLIGQPRPASSEFVIGLHAKSLRANLDPLAVADVVVSTAAEFADARVRLDIDENVFSRDDHRGAVGAALRTYGGADHVDVRVHPRFSDEELWQYLREIDVSVLPYRFGTHSGWLEACYDLGTAVVTPDYGHYASQRPVTAFRFGPDTFEPETLATAIRQCYAARGRNPAASREAREQERTDLSRLQHNIYERALA